MDLWVSKAGGTFFVADKMGVVRVSTAYVFILFYTQQRLLFTITQHCTNKLLFNFQEGTVSFVGFLLYHRYPKYYLENSCNLIFNLIQCLNFKMVVFNN